MGSENNEGLVLQFKDQDFLKAYLKSASMSLALARAIECIKLSSCRFEKPVLDLGCGDGIFASVLFKEPLDVGIDISPLEIKRAEASGMYKELLCADSSRLPCADNHFGAVLSNCVIEHVDELDRTFREAYRVLRPGGRFIFTTHSHLYEDLFFCTRLLKRLGFPRLGEQYARFWSRLWKHQQFMSIEDWTDRLVKAGFVVERAEYYFSNRSLTFFELLLPFSVSSYICRLLTGKWRLWPRTITMKPALMILEKAYRNFSDGKWCVLMVSRRPG